MAIAAPVENAPRPRPGQPILIDVSQQLDGSPVGGLTLALQPPREPGDGTSGGTGSADAAPRWFASLETGLGWPVGAMRDHYDPGPHFGLRLERRLASRFRVGLEAGYHAFPVEAALAPRRDNLGVTHLALVGRALATSVGYRPFLQVGVGTYRVLGSWRSGVQAGAGLEIPVTSRLAIAGGFAAHFVHGPAADRDLRWVDALLGFGFALP